MPVSKSTTIIAGSLASIMPPRVMSAMYIFLRFSSIAKSYTIEFETSTSLGSTIVE